MEKVVVGQKVLRNKNTAGYEFWASLCKEYGFNPEFGATVVSVNNSGEWFDVKEVKTKRGLSNVWCASCFDPFIEPAEASPTVVFTCAEPPKADSDGWIEWHGGECPVGNDVLVDYRIRDGDGKVYTHSKPGHLRWDHKDWPGDIVAYRPHVKEKTEEQKLRDRLDILESGYNEEINKRINAEREASEKIAKLESQLNDELHNRMSREQLVARLRVILGVNGREFKAMKADRDELKVLNYKMAIEIANCNQVIANHSKLMQAQDVVIEQSRDNVKLALVLAASPEISGDAVDYLARLVRKDEQDQKAKIDKLMNDRYVVDMPF